MKFNLKCFRFCKDFLEKKNERFRDDFLNGLNVSKTSRSHKNGYFLGECFQPSRNSFNFDSHPHEGMPGLFESCENSLKQTASSAEQKPWGNFVQTEEKLIFPRFVCEFVGSV
jgi:hypothetical protein